MDYFVGKSGSGKSTLADVIFSGHVFGNENVHVPVEVLLSDRRFQFPAETRPYSLILEYERG